MECRSHFGVKATFLEIVAIVSKKVGVYYNLLEASELLRGRSVVFGVSGYQCRAENRL